MRIVKLAAGVAVGYVLGARAGREQYERIAATARRVGGNPDAVATPEPAAPVALVVAEEKPRRPRTRRPKAVTEAAEADVVEQRTPVVDRRDVPAPPMSPLESDAVDAAEQRRSI